METQEFEILPLDLTVTGDAKGNVALYHKSVFEFLDHLAVVELKSDEDFLKATDLIKELKAQEILIDGAEEKAKNGSVTVADAFRMLAESKAAFRKARLALNTQVETEKKTIRLNIIEKAGYLISEHKEDLFYSLGLEHTVITGDVPDFWDEIDQAMKGKSSVLKIQESVDKVVAQAKEKISSILNLMASNKAFVELQPNQQLFPDLSKLVAMPFIELQNEIKDRNEKEEVRLQEVKEQARIQAEQKLKDDQDAEDARQRALQMEQGEPTVKETLPVQETFKTEQESVNQDVQTTETYKIHVNGVLEFKGNLEAAKELASSFRAQFGYDAVQISKPK